MLCRPAVQLSQTRLKVLSISTTEVDPEARAQPGARFLHLYHESSIPLCNQAITLTAASTLPVVTAESSAAKRL